MSNAIAIVERNRSALADLASVLRGTRYDTRSIESQHPIKDATRIAPRGWRAMVVALDEGDDVADVRSLVETLGDTPLLLRAVTKPPSAAVARVARRLEANIIGTDEPPIVVVATLVAILAPSRGLAC